MPKFVPRQRKQKHRQNNSNDAAVDTNAAEILPISKSEREARKQKLREELRAQHTKISAKKQKRLDKYIVCDYELLVDPWISAQISLTV
jgi:ATP-dependent RNA helicase DHX37/DHR1